MIRSARCALRIMCFAATCILGAAPAGAQWRIDAQAGRLQYDAAPGAATTSFAVGLSRLTRNSTFSVSTGVPFTGEEPVWAALEGSRRLATSGTLAFGVDLAADAFGYYLPAPDSARLLLIPDDGDAITGWGVAAEIMPLAVWTRSGTTSELRAGVVAFTSSATDVEAYERTAFVVDGSIMSRSWRGVAARVDGRFVSVADSGSAYAGLSLSWTGAASVWGSIGRWFDTGAGQPTWDAGASIPLGRRVSLLLTGSHAETDPVYDTPPRTTWGAGVSIQLGELARTLAEPVPSAYADGVATILLADDDVEGVPSIAGDFNDWTPEPMVRDEAADAWVARVPLAPGVYNYAFVDEAGEWFVPEDTPGRHSDGMGGYVAVLVVSE